MSLSRRHFLQGLSLAPLALSVNWASVAFAEDSQTVSLVIHGGKGPTRFDVEVADDDPERNRGLMERTVLAADAGMLFLYDRPVFNGFWMYRTLLPLDIAFIDEQGHILEIQHMQPCLGEASSCPATQPREAYLAALEVNAGTFDRLGIRVGDCVTWPGSTGTCEGPAGHSS